MTRVFWYALALLLAASLGTECTARADLASCESHGNGVLIAPCPAGGTGAICYENIANGGWGPQANWGPPVFTSTAGESMCRQASYICVPWCREYKPSPTPCSNMKHPRFGYVWTYAWDNYQPHTFTATTPYMDQWLFPEDTAKFSSGTCSYPGARFEAAGVGTFRGKLFMAPLGGSSMLTGTLTDFFGGVWPASVYFLQ